jgi:integrase
MANRKCWSRTVGARRGNRVRVYERQPDGNLYAAVYDPERRAYNQASLGHRDKERALRDAAELVRLREIGEDPTTGPLTLGTLVARYLAESTTTRDGSLKTENYRKGCARYGAYLIEFFGANTPVRELTASRMMEYARARRSGKISGRPVNATAVQQDIKLLKSMMTWATMVLDSGCPLLDRNPLLGFSVPREPNPRRPVIDAETVNKLMAVAERVSPLMPLLITLMDTTGRRLGSVVHLRWDDFDFERKTIRWRAEHDKKRKTWVVPMPKRAEQALLEFRAKHPAIGSALVFPMRKDPSTPVSRHLAADWLHRAFRYAGLPRPKGALWHTFRRKFATERKFYPLKDVAEAGGWKDVGTLLTCYQMADEETIRAVIDNPKPVQRPGAGSGG